jgi:Domain of unknown function (DUF1835)
MPRSEDSRELHIAPGASAGGTIKSALNLPSGCLLDSLDVLSVGPLFRFQTLDDWRAAREQYWRSIADVDFSLSEYPRDILRHTERVSEADSITVWIGTGLSDQMLFIWLPQFLRLLGVEPERLRIIQFANDPVSGREIISVGELSPEKIKQHPPAIPIDGDSLAAADLAWNAVTADDPWPLVNFLAQNAGPPFLKQSLGSLLYRYPDIETGLSYLKMKLLEMVVEQGPKAVRVIGYTMIRTMDLLDPVGDWQLFAWLRSLGSPAAQRPLVSITGNPENMREAEVRITDVGRRVMAREANFVALNGIDEWIGGVHLATERVWYQQDGVIVADHRLQSVDRPES